MMVVQWLICNPFSLNSIVGQTSDTTMKLLYKSGMLKQIKYVFSAKMSQVSVFRVYSCDRKAFDPLNGILEFTRELYIHSLILIERLNTME
jgi:hypothetical protein